MIYVLGGFFLRLFLHDNNDCLIGDVLSKRHWRKMSHQIPFSSQTLSVISILTQNKPSSARDWTNNDRIGLHKWLMHGITWKNASHLFCLNLQPQNFSEYLSNFVCSADAVLAPIAKSRPCRWPHKMKWRQCSTCNELGSALGQEKSPLESQLVHSTAWALTFTSRGFVPRWIPIFCHYDNIRFRFVWQRWQHSFRDFISNICDATNSWSFLIHVGSQTTERVKANNSECLLNNISHHSHIFGM